jgi:ABC-type glutathione transport system ATPase component
VIRLERLAKTFDTPVGPVHALRETSLAVAQREGLGLLGFIAGAALSLGLSKPDQWR